LRPHANTITVLISKAALQQGAITGAADPIAQGSTSRPLCGTGMIVARAMQAVANRGGTATHKF